MPLMDEQKQSVYDRVRQKLSQDYTDERRAELEDEVRRENRKPGMIVGQALAGIGQSLQSQGGGRSGGIDFSYFDKIKDQRREDVLGGFDKRKKSLFDDANQESLINENIYQEQRKDPNSEVSKNFVSKLAAVNPKLAGRFDGMSVQEAEKLFPTLVNQVEAQTEREFRKNLEDQKFKRDLFLAEQEARLKGKDLTPGQKKVDQTFAVDYDKWTSGGKKKAYEEINKLKNITSLMKSGVIKTGGTRGMLPDRLTSDNLLKARSGVFGSIMASLRQILGTQFTEKEGQLVIKSTWDEAQSTKNNLERVESLIESLEAQAKAKDKKVEYFSKNGSLFTKNGSVYDPLKEMENQENEDNAESVNQKENAKFYPDKTEQTSQSMPETEALKLEGFTPIDQEKIKKVYEANKAKGFTIDDVIKKLSEQNKIKTFDQSAFEGLSVRD